MTKEELELMVEVPSKIVTLESVDGTLKRAKFVSSQIFSTSASGGNPLVYQIPEFAKKAAEGIDANTYTFSSRCTDEEDRFSHYEIVINLYKKL